MFKKLLNLLSDAAVYGLSSLISQIVGFLLLPVLTRYLEPREFGIAVMLGIVSALFLPLANLGMSNAVFRRFNLQPDEHVRARVIGTALVSVAISSAVVLAVTLAMAPQIAGVLLGDSGSAALVRVSLVSAAAAAIGMVPFVALRAARRVRTAAAVNVSKVLLSVTVTLLLVVGWRQGVWGVVIGTLVGEVTLAMVLVGLAWNSLWGGFDKTIWRQMAAYGLPFVPHHVQAVGVDLFGLYMVREMLGLGAAAMYGIATRFAKPVTFVVNAVQASWVPYKFQVHAEDADSKSFFQSTFTYYVAALSYLWVGVALWGPDAVRLLIGADYHQSAFLIWAVALIPVSQGLYYMSGTGIELSDNTRPMPLVSFLGLLTVVGGAFLLIEPLGALGAALATATGWLAMAVAIYTLSQRRFAISYDWPTIAGFCGLAAIVVTLGNVFVQPLTVAPRLIVIVLLSVAYPLVGFAFLLRSRDERGRMLYLLSKFRMVPSSR